MSIVMSTKHFPNSKQAGRIFFKSTREDTMLVKELGEIFCLKGEVFGVADSFEDIAKRVAKNGFDE